MDDRETVVIATEGNWDKVQNKPKIIVTIESENFRIKKDEDCKLDFSVQEQYTYKVKKNGPNVGMIVGIVVACVVVVAAIIVLAVFLIIKKRKAQEKSENEGNGQETNAENV